MKQANFHDITVALAAIFQNCLGVHQLALTGKVDEHILKTAMHSIYQLNPSTIQEIFAGEDKLAIGFQELAILFTKQKKKKISAVTRYVLTVLFLSFRLRRKKSALKEIRRRIEQSTKQVEYFHLTHPTVIANLSDLYTDVISGISPEVRIIGKATYLHNQRIMQQIRVLLLAALRAAILWQQVGGRRYHFIFARQKIMNSAKKLANSYPGVGS